MADEAKRGVVKTAWWRYPLERALQRPAWWALLHLMSVYCGIAFLVWAQLAAVLTGADGQPMPNGVMFVLFLFASAAPFVADFQGWRKARGG